MPCEGLRRYRKAAGWESRYSRILELLGACMLFADAAEQFYSLTGHKGHYVILLKLCLLFKR
jgi:hypothetical protein